MICLRYFYVTILRDRELIGGISRLVQFFHVESNDGRKTLYAAKTLHGECLYDIPRYTVIDLSKIIVIQFIKTRQFNPMNTRSCEY